MKQLLLLSIILAFVSWSSDAWATTRYLPGGTADQTASFQNLVKE